MGKTADAISYISLVKAYNQHKQLKNGYTIPDLKADIMRYKRNYNDDGMLRFASDSKKDYAKNGNRGAVYGLKPRYQYLKYFDDEYYNYEPSNNNEEEGEPINLCSDTETNNDYNLIKEANETLTTRNKELEEENQKLKKELEELYKELEENKKLFSTLYKENENIINNIYPPKGGEELKAKAPIKRGRGRPKKQQV